MTDMTSMSFSSINYIGSSTADYAPPTVVSDLPDGHQFGRIPTKAQAVINALLTKREAALLIYYMSLPKGFAPSAREVRLHTNISQGDLVRTRHSLHEQGFIVYDKDRNTITICWDYILELGRITMMLLDDGYSIRETIKNGKYYGKTIKSDEKVYFDKDEERGGKLWMREREVLIWENERLKGASRMLNKRYDGMSKRKFGYTTDDIDGLSDEELAVLAEMEEF